MRPMRAAFVLALLFGVATPPGWWHLGADPPSGGGAATAALSAPAGALCQLGRDSAKTAKTPFGGGLPALHCARSLPLFVASEHSVAYRSHLPAIAIDCLPLSPRPPPA